MSNSVPSDHRHKRSFPTAKQVHSRGALVRMLTAMVVPLLAVSVALVTGGADAAGGGLVAVERGIHTGSADEGDLSCPASICTDCPSILVPLVHSDEDISKVLSNFCPQLEGMIRRGSNAQESAPYMSPFQALGFDWKAMSAAGSCTNQQSSQIGFASDTLGLGIAVGTISLACNKGYSPSTSSSSVSPDPVPLPPQISSSVNMSHLQTFLIQTGETPSGVGILGCDGYSYNGYSPGTGPGGNDGTSTFPALRDCFSMIEFGMKPTVPCPSCSGDSGIVLDTFRPALLPTIVRALGVYASYFTPTAPTTYTAPPLEAIDIYYQQLIRLFPVLLAMDVGGFVAEEPNITTATTPNSKEVISGGDNTSSTTSMSSSSSTEGPSPTGSLMNTTTTTPVIHTTSPTANTTTTTTNTTTTAPVIHTTSPTTNTTTTTTTNTTTTSAPSNVTTRAPSFNLGPQIRTLSVTPTEPVPETPPPTFHPGPSIRTLSATITPTRTRLVMPPDGFNNTALTASQVGLWYWATQVGLYRPPSGPLRQFIANREKALSRVLCQEKGYPLSSSSSLPSSSPNTIVNDPNVIPFSVRVQTSTHDPGFFPVIETSVYDAFTQLMTVATLGYHDFMEVCPNPPSPTPSSVSETDQPIAVLLAALNDLAVWGYVGPSRWVLGLSSIPEGTEVDVEITAMSLMCLSEIVNDLTVQMVAAPFLSSPSSHANSASSLKRPNAAHQAAAESKLASLRSSIKGQSMEALQQTLYTTLSSTSVVSAARRERLTKAAEHNAASPYHYLKRAAMTTKKQSAGLGSIFTILQHLLTWEAILQASPIINTKYRICHINPTASFPTPTTNTTYGGMYGMFNLRKTGTNIPQSSNGDSSPLSLPLRTISSYAASKGTPLNPSKDPITDACRSTFVSFRATAMWVMGIGQGNFFTGRRGLPQHIQPTPPDPPPGQTGDPSFLDLHETTVLVVSITTGSIIIIGSILAVGVQVWRARSKGSFYDSALDVEGVRESHYTAETDRVSGRDRGTSRNQPSTSSPDRKGKGKSVGADGGIGSVPGSPVSNSQPHNNHSGLDGPARGYGSVRSDPSGNIIGQEEDPSGGLGFF